MVAFLNPELERVKIFVLPHTTGWSWYREAALVTYSTRVLWHRLVLTSRQVRVISERGLSEESTLVSSWDGPGQVLGSPAAVWHFARPAHRSMSQ